MKKISIYGLDWLILAALTAVTVALLRWDALRRLDFFDVSAFLDAGYRVSSGQVPYRDFLYCAGPVHLYMHAIFLKLFGFTKTAVQAHLCTISCIMVFLTYVTARRELNRLVSTLLAVVTVLCFYGPIGHPWYDQNAWFWMFLAVFTVLLMKPLRSVNHARLTGLLAGCFVALSFFCKSNVGAFGGLALVGPMLLSGYPVVMSTSALAGFLCSAAAVLLPVTTLHDYYYQNWICLSPGGRLLNYQGLRSVFYLSMHPLFMPLACVPMLVGGRDYARRNMQTFVLLVGVSLAACLSAWTGSMVTSSNMSAVALEVLLLALLTADLVRSDATGDAPTPRLRFGVMPAVALAGFIGYRLVGGNTPCLIGLCLILICLLAADLPRMNGLWRIQLKPLLQAGAGQSLLVVLIGFMIGHAARQTVDQQVWHWRKSNAMSDYALQTRGLEGWHCCARHGQGFDKMVAFIKSNIPEKDSLFVYPDMTLIYGATGRPSYRYAPFFFGVGYPADALSVALFRDRFRQAPPDWIVEHTDPELSNPAEVMKWLELYDYIAGNYVMDRQWDDFRLLKRKGAR